jgi:hypothetical protein
MQQRLMLRGGTMRRRDRRHRFHALALPGHEQTPAIVAQWPNPVRTPRLQSERGVVGFFREHRGQPLPSAALMSNGLATGLQLRR